MKNIFKTTIIGLLILNLASCKDEELRTHFPASTPVFNQASVTENAIVYGDSIHLAVDVTDPLTPLSMLEVQIIVNDEIVTAEKIRTKGNSATYNQKYRIPFVAHMPDGAKVEVHLSSINVEGTRRDTVLINTIASRPAIPTIYMVTPTATIEMKLIDAANYIYSAEGLTLANSINFRLATKLTKFKKIDWTNEDNMVFGWINNQVGLAAVTISTDAAGNKSVVSVAGDVIPLADPSLVGYKKITLDLFNFTVKGEGDKLTPATLMDINNFATLQKTSIDHMNVATKEDWKILKMYLGKNTEMTINGVAAVGNSMDPTFFEVTGTDKVKFLGETGVYTVYYLPRLDYVFVEQPEAVYPNALWLVGVGMGPARTPYIKTTSWNWTTPLEYRFCRKVSEGVFETVFFAEHVVDPVVTESWRLTFGVKFMHQRDWGNEESSQNYTMPNSYLYSPTPENKGNFAGTADFANLPGIYRFTINTKNKTTSFVKIK